ncbi:MAG: molybdopterin-dependent oxidoreductase [Deltaproteobacteria bacterium]|nr:molybdopterin-dependent oxidoreductase [Deltaproteobacteria bacterium]
MLTHEPLRRFSGTRKNHDRVIETVCQECTVGCGLLAYVKDERIVDVQGDEAHPVSRGRLCAKGMAFVQGVTHPDRITLPATRNGLQGPFEAVDNWEKGLDLLAERLRRIKDRHGPESLVVGCDPEAGLDFFLGALRFAKLWGTPHVYHPLSESKDRIPPGELIDPWAPCTSWLDSQCIFLMEADLATTHPVAFGWVLDAQHRGAKVCAVDTRFTTTLSKADMSIVIRPESGNLLGLVLMKMLIEEGFYSRESIKNRFVEPDAWLTSFNGMSLDGAEQNIGLSAENITPIVRFLAGNKSLTLVTGKRLAFFPYHGIWSTMARAMGWADNTGGWYPLESGWPRLNTTGDISGSNDKFPVVKKTGLAPYQFTTDWVAAAGEMEPKAMICTGNCLNDFFSPFQPRVKDMDLVIYFGSYPNLTRKLAHMVFPAAVWAERDGLCFSNDRTIQWGSRIVWPSDACRSGLGFWIRLAQRFGWEEYFPWKKENGLADHTIFYNWIFDQIPETVGCRVEQLQDTSQLVCWPVQDKAQPPPKITPIQAPPDIEPTIRPDEEDRFPLRFQATRIISRTNDVVHWWPWTRELMAENAVQIHPETARVLGIENGDDILVSGAVQTMEGNAWISRMVPRWMVWSPRKLGERRVVVHKKEQTSQEAFDILKALLP